MPPTIISVLEKLLSQAELVTLGGRKIVIKRYTSEAGLLKWYIAAAVSVGGKIYPFATDPQERMSREAALFRSRVNGVNFPEVILVNYVSRELYREYVEGRQPNPVSCSDIAEVARALSRLHSANWSLGDSKYTNFLISERGPYVIDGEQATGAFEPSKGAWDLLMLLSTISISGYSAFVIDHRLYSDILDCAMSAYAEGEPGIARDVLEKLATIQYKALITALIPFPLSVILLKWLGK